MPFIYLLNDFTNGQRTFWHFQKSLILLKSNHGFIQIVRLFHKYLCYTIRMSDHIVI